MIDDALIISDEDREWILNNVTEDRQDGKPPVDFSVFPEDYEYTGILGEFEFSRMFALPLDTSKRLNGDKGIDFNFNLTIDVKTAKNPKYLIVKEDHVNASIYVLSKMHENKAVEFIGWTWGSKVMKAPIDDGTSESFFKHGIRNHYIPAQDLYPMKLLKDLIDSGRGC